MTDEVSPVYFSDTATARSTPKIEDIGGSAVALQVGVCMRIEGYVAGTLTATPAQVLATEISRSRDEIDGLRCELAAVCRELDCARDQRDAYVQQRNTCARQRDHYRTERDRYRAQRNYYRDLLAQEMDNNAAAGRARAQLAAIEESNARVRGGLAMVWEEPAAGTEGDPTQFVAWEDTSTAWEETRSAMMMDELGLFDDDDDEVGEEHGLDPADESGGVAVQEHYNAHDGECDARDGGEGGLYGDDGEGDLYCDTHEGDLYHIDEEDPNETDGAPAIDASAYPALDASTYPAPGALSPPSPDLSLPPSPTVSGQSSNAISGESSHTISGSGSSYFASAGASAQSPTLPSETRARRLRSEDWEEGDESAGIEEPVFGAPSEGSELEYDEEGGLPDIDEAYRTPENRGPDYSLVLDGLDDFILGARARSPNPEGEGGRMQDAGGMARVASGTTRDAEHSNSLAPPHCMSLSSLDLGFSYAHPSILELEGIPPDVALSLDVGMAGNVGEDLGWYGDDGRRMFYRDGGRDGLGSDGSLGAGNDEDASAGGAGAVCRGSATDTADEWELPILPEEGVDTVHSTKSLGDAWGDEWCEGGVWDEEAGESSLSFAAVKSCEF
ncbi:hypothetical protein HDZ31DRAFT_61522 [Schizophyllum fasciatum]